MTLFFPLSAGEQNNGDCLRLSNFENLGLGLKSHIKLLDLKVVVRIAESFTAVIVAPLCNFFFEPPSVDLIQFIELIGLCHRRQQIHRGLLLFK